MNSWCYSLVLLRDNASPDCLFLDEPTITAPPLVCRGYSISELLARYSNEQCVNEEVACSGPCPLFLCSPWVMTVMLLERSQGTGSSVSAKLNSLWLQGKACLDTALQDSPHSHN